jgi:hypothetical protein
MTETPRVRDDVAFERTWLDDGSWVDVARGWLAGHEQVYDALSAQDRWQQGRIFRYDRWIDEPRVGSFWRTGDPPPHPVLVEAQRALRARYQVPLDGFAMAWYRDERDSQAFHRDRDLRWLDDTLIALLTLGARRPWLLRPRANRYDHEAPAGRHRRHRARGRRPARDGRGHPAGLGALGAQADPPGRRPYLDPVAVDVAPWPPGPGRLLPGPAPLLRSLAILTRP